MAYDRFLIAPFETGLQRNVKPWLILDDAFETLQNAYVWRGRIRKRFGSRLMGFGWSSSLTEPLFSRLRILIGTTNGAGNLSVTVPGSVFKVGQQFSCANEILTVSVTGAPAVLLTTGASTVHTYNTTTGAFVINGGAAATPVWFYPAEPVMAFGVYSFGTINNEPSYAFDTQFAYLFSGGFWQRYGNLEFNNGNNLTFVWNYIWQSIAAGSFPSIFATNYSVTNKNGLGTLVDDPIWVTTTDGSVSTVTWVPFSYSPDVALNPANTQPYTVVSTTNATGNIILNFVQSARIIVPFKDRLVMLNTIENTNVAAITPMTPASYAATSTNRQYVNRCRYSHNGSPFSTSAWLEKNQVYNPGTGLVTATGGGYLDAPTEEQIISAEFIKDRLIVFFERSTWELAYTGNQILPFVWQKLNTELGAESQFCTVPFDKVILAMSQVGMVACNGSNVEEIDDKIPDTVYEIQGANRGIERVCAIRDYYTNQAYWAYPAITQRTGQVYPAQVLVFNYDTGSWAINNDSITAFGYFEQQPAQTWANSTETWEQATQTWASGTVAANTRQILAGNQQGYVFICDADEPRNARNLQITNMVAAGSATTVTIIDHNLQSTNVTNPLSGDYIKIENIQGATLSGTGIYSINYVNNNTISIPATLTGTYTGGGTASRVSNIYLKSKQWNPYIEKGSNVYIAKIDFGVDKTEDGEVIVDYFPSQTDLSMLDEGGVIGTGSLMGNGVLETRPYDANVYPLEQAQQTLWHPLYFETDGETIQIVFYMNPDQMEDATIAFSDFVLQGMVLHTQKTSSRLQ